MVKGEFRLPALVRPHLRGALPERCPLYSTQQVGCQGDSSSYRTKPLPPTPSPPPPPRNGEGEKKKRCPACSPSPCRGGGWGEGFSTQRDESLCTPHSESELTIMQTRATFRRGLILVAGALLVAGSPLGTTGGLGASQDKGTEEALKAIRAELQKRCAKEEDLRGVLVVRVGPSRMLDRCALLCLVDDPKQAKLLKTRADAAVAANPDWKKRYPLGVEVQETVFPLRSQYVKEFQKAFATTDWATKEEQGVLPRTRLDDAYYNA